MWKTRLRCALNKSPDFQEVPERNQLDITEPYKVYLIVEGSGQAKWAGRDSKKVHFSFQAVSLIMSQFLTCFIGFEDMIP